MQIINAIEIDPKAIEANELKIQQLAQPAQSTETISTDATPNIYVNGVHISEQDVFQEMQYHSAESARESMIEAAQSLIITELLKQRSDALGINPDQSLTEEQVFEALLRAQVNIPRCTDDECEQYYQANQVKFMTSPILEVEHILLAADKEDLEQRAESQELAEQLLTKIKQAPHLFADFAMRHSMCPSKEQAGNLGQISKGQTVPEFERALFLSEAGLMGQPVETRYGFHIVNINRKIPAEQLPFEAVEIKIRDYLNEKVKRKSIAQYIQTLIEAATIEGFAFDESNSPLMQ